MGSRPSDEGGFTLLELVVALGILAVAVGGLLSVFGAALKTTAVDTHRVDATSIASATLAELRSTPYADLAIGRQSSSQRTLNNQVFAVTPDVEWITASSGQAQAYKQAAVTVTWSDQGGSHSVTQQAGDYPGGLGAYSGPTGPDPTTTTTDPSCIPPATPAAPSLGVPASGDPSVDVSWSEPSVGVAVVKWDVQISSDGTTWTTARTVAGLDPAASHTLELGGLAPATTYSVRLGAYATCGGPTLSPVATAPAATPAVTGSGCRVASVSLSDPVAQRTSSGALSRDVTVAAAITSPCPTGLWAGVVTSGSATAVVQLDASGRGVLAATGSWDSGAHLVEVFPGTVTPGPLPSGQVAEVAMCVQAGGTSC